MRGSLAILLAAGALGACASAGGFPKTQDAGASIAAADRAIADAVAAGADTLAAAMMNDARMHINAARGEMTVRKPERADLHAREATADARYAKSVAEQLIAERARADASAALQALPPEGDER